MKCPHPPDWELLASEALPPEQADPLLAHARICDACWAKYEVARLDHVDRVRMYETFDRDHDERREQLMAALPDTVPHRNGTGGALRVWNRLGDYVMSLNTSTGRRALAVLVPAACLLFIVGWFVVGGEQSAFATAIDRLKQAKTITCRISMPKGFEMHGMQIQAEGTLHMSDEHGSRVDMTMNGMPLTQQFTKLDGMTTSIQPLTKTYMEFDISQLGFMEVSEQTPDAFVRALFSLTDEAATELGSEVIDEREAVGYRIPGEKLGFALPNSPDGDETYAELWVDLESRLPARFLIHMPIAVQDTSLTMVYDEFEWDQPLEPDLFDPAIPEDYTKLEAQLVKPTEEALMNTLQRIRSLTDGRYPPALDSVSVLAALHPMITAQGRAELDELGQAGIMQLGLEVAGGAMYYMKLVRDGRDPEYFGETVTADDADQVLLRWSLDDGQIRVIYGDLEVETLPAE
ncbi:MAG: hypothetical protein GY778_27090 [bacterium]|nr:hypothetical protein [bacterium]